MNYHIRAKIHLQKIACEFTMRFGFGKIKTVYFLKFRKDGTLK